MKLLLPTLMLIAATFVGGATMQKNLSMIGKHKEEVRELVKQDYKGFRRDNTIVNQQFNYLKYVNAFKTRTWIIYFTEDDICRSSKLVCDYNEYDEVLEELNTAYDLVGENKWEYELKKETISVTLNRQQYYFSVREARKK
jgi:hypothetical protein